jgi:hypothetical protein
VALAALRILFLMPYVLILLKRKHIVYMSIPIIWAVR